MIDAPSPNTPTTAGEAGPQLLRLRGIQKFFGAVHALRGADFEVSAGEVVALMGDNGAGKSTLVKTIAGVYPVDEGEMVFEGASVQFTSPAAANHLGIETVYQDLALCDNLDIASNMFLGRELGMYRFPWTRRWTAARILAENEMLLRARQVLEDLHVSTIQDVRARVSSLSGGQRQAVAIARAVMWNSKIVILDEPTAALGVQQTRQVLDLVLRLKAKGLGVVLISHDVGHVFEVADRIDVLRLGRRVTSKNRSETTPSKIVAAITGALTEAEG